MQIKVLYFAQLAERLGREAQIVEVDAGFTVRELLQKVQVDWTDQDLKTLPLLKAVNEEYCEEFQVLNPGDCVAFLPPVAGG